MSEHRDNSPVSEEQERPPLPPRPSTNDFTQYATRFEQISQDSEESSLRRKPVIPRRPFNAPTYEPIRLKHMGATGISYDHDDGNVEAEADLIQKPPPPKAFHRTHKIWGYNLGYWRMPVRHASIFSALFLVSFLPIWFSNQKLWNMLDNNVQGPFSFDCTGAESGWSFVGINIRVGGFQYGTAKTIDLAWNWVVGRGLQGMFSLIAYRVFQDALLRVTEMTPLPYKLYATLALYSTRIDMIWQLLKGLFRYGNWRTKAIFVWLLISTIYLAFFPSLMDLCSGYDTAYTSNFQWPNLTLTNTDDLDMWDFSPSTVIVNTTMQCCTWNYNYTTKKAFNTTCEVSDDCLSDDAYTGPTSNHSTLYYWVDSDLNTTYWNKYAVDPGEIDESKWNNWHFAPVNPDNFKCIAQNNRYQWGFSAEWLFVAAIVNSLWLLGLWIVWLDCDTNSELCKKRRRLGLWRAIADISEVMREELGPNVCAYTEQELAEVLEHRPPVKYAVSKGVEDDLDHIGLSSRPSGRLRLVWNREYGTKRE